MTKRILAIAGRVARHPWSHGRIVADACAGLAQRGHAVTLMAHSVDDPAPMRGAGVHILAREDYVSHATHFPLGMAEWIDRTIPRDMGATDGVLVMTRLIGLDRLCSSIRAVGNTGPVVFAPLEPAAGEWWRAMLDTRGALGLCASLVRERGVLAHAAREMLPNAPQSLPDGVRPIEWTYAPLSASNEPAVRGDARALRERAEARRALGLGPGKWALLVSAVEAAPLGIEPCLSALLRGASMAAQAARTAGARSSPTVRRTPVVLVLSHQPFHVHAREIAARVDESGWNALGQGVRLLGSTERMDAALLASDAAALLPRAGDQPRRPNPLRASRLACDARWLGVPILGSMRRAGLGPGALLVDDEGLNDAERWRELIERAMDREFLGADASAEGDRTAERARGELSLARLLDRLESLLMR